VALRLRQWRLYGDFLDFDFLQRFVAKKHCNFSRQLAEFLVPGLLIPDQRKFVLYAGVIDFFVHAVWLPECATPTQARPQSWGKGLAAFRIVILFPRQA
jgi:hypothetical protein